MMIAILNGIYRGTCYLIVHSSTFHDFIRDVAILWSIANDHTKYTMNIQILLVYYLNMSPYDTIHSIHDV